MNPFETLPYNMPPPAASNWVNNAIPSSIHNANHYVNNNIVNNNNYPLNLQVFANDNCKYSDPFLEFTFKKPNSCE
eukprot:Pgem_evm1s16922